jgi:hypothetical protein
MGALFIERAKMANAKPKQPLPEADPEGKIIIDKRYLIELRTENKTLRIRIRELLDELAALRGETAPVNPIEEIPAP